MTKLFNTILEILAWGTLILAILAFFPELELAIHEPSAKHIWDFIGDICLIIVAISLIRTKKDAGYEKFQDNRKNHS
jgi:hypothetical protein